MTPSPVRTAAVLLAALALGAPAAAQAPSTRGGPTPALFRAQQQTRDSARALRGVRAAQAGFERLRFNALPWINDPGSSDRCDERVGRFCFWHDDSDRDWRPPPETERVTEGRARLLARLDEAAAAAPGDEWIAGQRVRYLVEAGRAAEAVAAAAGCRAGWWCQALAGYAHHAAGDYAGAEAAFGAALAAMPERERREWTDVGVLIPDGERGAYRRAQGPAREEMERRFWWLSDPLWSVPGNDLRTEYLARRVFDRLQDRARTTEGWVWAEDLSEIMLRYGIPTGWERIRQRAWAQPGSRASVIAHYAPRSWTFTPPLRAVRDPRSLRADDFDLRDKRPRSVYAPLYATDFRDAGHQVAVFRRGGRGVVVAAYDLDPDSVRAETPVDAALVLARDESAEPQVVRALAQGPTGVLRAEADAGPLFASIEARAEADTIKRVGRARMALELPAAPASGIAVSDVLLLAGAGTLPETLDEAVPLARGSTRVRAGERIGMFWEVYRPAAGAAAASDTLSVSVSVEREGEPGLGRRLGQALGVAGRDAPVRVTWRQAADGLPVAARALAVAIPDVRPGDYTLRITVRPTNGPPATATRRITVVKD